jgi:hypothetical protein
LRITALVALTRIAARISQITERPIHSATRSMPRDRTRSAAIVPPSRTAFGGRLRFGHSDGRLRRVNHGAGTLSITAAGRAARSRDLCPINRRSGRPEKVPALPQGSRQTRRCRRPRAGGASSNGAGRPRQAACARRSRRQRRKKPTRPRRLPPTRPPARARRRGRGGDGRPRRLTTTQRLPPA